MKHRIEQPEAEEDDRNFHQQIATIKLKMSSDDEKNFPSTNALLQFFPLYLFLLKQQITIFIKTFLNKLSA